MRRKKLVTIFITIAIFGLWGCGNDKEFGNPAPTNTPTNTPTQAVTGLFSPVEDKVINGENMEGSQLEIEKTENLDIEKYNAFNQKMSGAVSPSLFCVDGTTGITYFVNQNQNWYIYAIKGEEVTLAVELPAQELAVWNGNLYFILNDYDMYELDRMMEGDIYVYSPESGAVELVYPAGERTDKNYVYNSELSVNEEGIFFHRTVGMETMEYNGAIFNVLNTEDLHLPFGAVEPVEDKLKMTTPGWKEYRFHGGTDLELVKRADGNKTDAERKEIGIETSNGAILGDEFFYCNIWEAGYVNLESGESYSFLLKEFLQKTEEEKLNNLEDFLNTTTVNKEEMKIPTVRDFTVTQNDIWCLVGSKDLIRINRQTGEYFYYIVEGEQKTIDKLYTDGKQIYGMYGETSSLGKIVSIVRIMTEEVMKLHEVYQLPVVEVQKLVQ